MNKYQWLVKEPISNEFKNQFPEVNPVILQLLVDRNLITQEQIDEFLMPDYSQDIHNPYLFSQMKQAVERIYQAREKREKVVIYGDYDADGVCGSAILAKVFKKLGINFEVYLPDRELEGYGLNLKAVKELSRQGFKLILTVDCGISNFLEVEQAQKLGLDVIITDHHQTLKEVPAALAIIHPNWDKSYPFKHLAGGGVAFKVAQALIQDTNTEKWLLDLVAISTVADMVPLIGENRTLVRHGLIVLTKTKNLGLQKLMAVAGIDQKRIDTYVLGWQIAPRINAAGRMTHANSAYQLLTTENIEEAITISHSLNKRNAERQTLTDKLIEAAKLQLDKVTDEQAVLFAYGKNWPAGIIGLVASKLVNFYCRPAIVLSQDERQYVASGRSIDEFNLIEALDNFKDYFERYGGHKGAAGFSISQEKFEEFKEKFETFAKEKLVGVKFIPKVIIDLELKLKNIDWPLIEALQLFEPFGQENFRPRFLIRNLMVMSGETVGQDGKHLRLIVKEDNLQRKVICFGFGEQGQLINPGDSVDIVSEVGVNEWNGNKEIQLSLIDIKKSG